MTQQNRWFAVLLTGYLVGSSFLAPLGRLYAAPSQEPAVSEALVNINKADTGELESVRGIGPALAQRIIQYRQTQGRFERLEDLVRVPGIGQAKFERMKSQLTL